VKPCPQCGAQGTITVSMQLVAKPLGTWSLPGSQMKAVCQTKAVLECSDCQLRVFGRLEGERMVGRTFVGGHFVADRVPVRAG